MKKYSDYSIYKNYGDVGESYDGPFDTLEDAFKVLEENYKDQQDFIIVKTTYEPVWVLNHTNRKQSE